MDRSQFTIPKLFKEEPEKTKCAPCLAQSVPHMTWDSYHHSPRTGWGSILTLSQPFQLREFRTGQLVGVMASSIRDLQILAQQHFAVRDPVIATDGAYNCSTTIFLSPPYGPFTIYNSKTV
jgi:hypothetical protein